MSPVRNVTHVSGLDKKGTGGQGGIRTHGELAPTAVFKTAALNHSATCPTLPPIAFVRVAASPKRRYFPTDAQLTRPVARRDSQAAA